MEFALRGSGQCFALWHSSLVLGCAGMGILWGWTWGEHANGRPGILRAAWEPFRLSFSGNDGEGHGGSPGDTF